MAQEDISPEESGCFECHQGLYWLFDSGRAVCFCTMEAYCTDCHSGQADTLDKDLAHTVMISSPVRDNAAICQDCHPDDYQERSELVMARIGVKPTAVAVSVSLPMPPSGSSAGSAQSSLVERQLPALWDITRFIIVGLAFCGVLLLGYRCWKLDCVARKQSK
jgi:hypothetical protein